MKQTKQLFLFFILCLLAQQNFAHNGEIAYAYPLGKITIDGNLSDWPANIRKYSIQTFTSQTKPTSASDFSGYFQVGYRADNRSLYISFVINDDDFIEDTSENVRYNSQDCLELCLDAVHLPKGSGVSSFMYSKKLRNTNLSAFDPFSSKASWKIMEVVMSTKGGQRIYEWRIQLGDQFMIGKSIGFDFQVFDKDNDGSFSFSSWGRGEQKFRDPKSLGDIVLLAPDTKFATATGKVTWDKPTKIALPGTIQLSSTQNKNLWFETAIDSLGNYSVDFPVGHYLVNLPDTYFDRDEKIYSTLPNRAVVVAAKAEQKIKLSTLTISSTPVPDLIPEKGVLLDFNSSTAASVDRFIETYRKYYNIPGVSLALIKDGKVVYHKTYGVKNTFTGEKVNDNTLFEAASVTKPVFAYTVQRLAERGLIDLDKPLYLYLPYKDIEHDERYKLITARHVLTHRTGFPNWRWMNADGKLDIKFTPGTSYNYSGEGFEYLKMVVEKITGKKVEQVLKEEVIEPIGLYHTFFSRNDSLRRMVANGHYDGMPNFDDLPASPGMAYSMHTEALIFTRFMMQLMEQRGLKAETYQTMFSKHSDFDWGNEKPKIPAYMGMSLEIRESAFGKTFGHGGNNGDFKCKFEVYKDKKMGYVLFTNSNTSDVLLEKFRNFLVEGKE